MPRSLPPKIHATMFNNPRQRVALDISSNSFQRTKKQKRRKKKKKKGGYLQEYKKATELYFSSKRFLRFLLSTRQNEREKETIAQRSSNAYIKDPNMSKKPSRSPEGINDDENIRRLRTQKILRNHLLLRGPRESALAQVSSPVPVPPSLPAQVFPSPRYTACRQVP